MIDVSNQNKYCSDVYIVTKQVKKQTKQKNPGKLSIPPSGANVVILSLLLKIS